MSIVCIETSRMVPVWLFIGFATGVLLATIISEWRHHD